MTPLFSVEVLVWNVVGKTGMASRPGLKCILSTLYDDEEDHLMT